MSEKTNHNQSQLDYDSWVDMVYVTYGEEYYKRKRAEIEKDGLWYAAWKKKVRDKEKGE